MTRRLLPLALLFVATVALACEGYISDDPAGTIVPPRIVGFKLSPDSINITKAPDTAMARVTVDAPTDVQSATVQLLGPGGARTASCTAENPVADGDATALECQLVLAPTDTVGMWMVETLVVTVAEFDPIELDAEALDVAGYPSALTVARDPTEADLSVALTAVPDPVGVDSTLSHTVTIANGGPDPITDLSWTLLVEGSVLISAPSQEGCSDFTSSDPPSKLFSCSLAGLDAGASQSFQLDVVPQQAGETLTSTARLETWTGATDSVLANNEAVETTTVEGVNQAPMATITAPADSSLFSSESTLTFEGSGSDPEDGALTGSSLVWTSDIDGDLGVGTSLATGPLSIGTHTVTLTATDSEGLTGTDAVTVGIAMPMGSNHQDSIAGQGDTDRFAFRADSGDVVNVAYLNETLDGRVYVTVLDSTGTQLRRVRSPFPLYGNYVETGLLELTATGWYFIEITGVDSGSAGIYRLGLSAISPPTAITLATPYADASGTMSVLGERQYFSFEGSASAVMNFAGLTPTSDLWFYVYVCSPGTEPFWSRSCFTNFRVGGTSGENGREVLPEKGTYILEIRTRANTFANFLGGYELRLFLPALAPIVMDQTYTDSITPAYDFDRFSVEHPTGLPAFLVRTVHSYSQYINTYVYSDPSTQVDWSRSLTPSYATQSAHEVGPLLLPSGTYLIEQDASGPGTPGYAFNVVSIEPPVTLTDSTQTEGTIDQPGERDYFQFTGAANQSFEVELASGTDHNGNVRVYPLPADGDYTQRDATPILSFGYDALTVVTDTVTLPADSTYIIEVDGGRYGIGGATGQYSLVINSLPAGDTGGDVYIAVESSDAVAVLDTASNSVTTNISVAQWPWAIGVAPDGSEVYTASRSDGSFTVIDAASSTVAATIGGVVNDPFDIAVSPDGAFVYVLDNNVGRVAIIDAAARAVSGELLGATRLPSALALDPSGDTAFVVAGDSVVAFDIATETPVDTLAGVFGLTADAAVTPDGTELVFTDFENNQLVIVDRASFSIAATVPEISEPRGMDLTGDGATAWIAARSSSTLVGVDLASRSFVAGISLPFQPYWVTVTPDGTIGYVTEGRGGTRLAVVDLVAGSVITTLTIGDGPAQIGIRP